MNRDDIPPIGALVYIDIFDIFNDIFTLECKIESEPFQHGYNSSTGSWGLYDISAHGYPCIPCYKIKKRHKTSLTIDINRIKSIRLKEIKK